VVRLPPYISKNAIAGTDVLIGDKVVGWVLDGDDAAGYTLYVDANGDGDLENDNAATMKRKDGAWTCDVETVTAESQTPLVLRFVALNGSLSVHYANLRRTFVAVRGHRVAAGIVGFWGNYSFRSAVVVVDRNLDGRFDLSERSSERLRVGEVTALFGTFVAFEPTPSALVGHEEGQDKLVSPLTHGSDASALEVNDINGRILRLAELRGAWILIDFMSVSCAPCFRAIPTLQQMANRVHVITSVLETATPRVRGALQQSGVTWDVTSESENDKYLAQRFGVREYPTYSLIRPDGIVECGRCDLNAIVSLLANVP